MQLGQPLMGQFLFLQGDGQHANHLSAGGKGGIGDNAHQPDLRPAIDETAAAAGDRLACLFGGGPVIRASAHA
ncbi:hypothetical protein GCM10007285_23930 [Stappia taiwanensis]|nr:hypothetical protein GCM10007285_23930 [Stappia taiwanensis]